MMDEALEVHRRSCCAARGQPRERLVQAARAAADAARISGPASRSRWPPGLADRRARGRAARRAACSRSAPPPTAASTRWPPTGRRRRRLGGERRPWTATPGAWSGRCTSPRPRSRRWPTSASAWRSGSSTSARSPTCRWRRTRRTDVRSTRSTPRPGGHRHARRRHRPDRAAPGQSGGFGCFLFMAHNWADTAATRHSYELLRPLRGAAVPGLGAHDHGQPGLGGREPPGVHRRRG